MLTVHENTGGGGDNGQDDAPDVVVQAHGADDRELGNGQRFAGNQGAQQKYAEHQIDVLDFKAIDGQRITAHGADEQRDEGAHHRQEQAVLHIAHEAAFQHRSVMLQRGGGGEQTQGVGEQLVGGLEGAEDNPHDGEDDDKTNGQRQNGHGDTDAMLFHQVSPPLLTLNWAKAMRANTIMTTVEMADA